ncbi:unnamed protein product [Effrenium voratum]|uniref:EF-hand domain-containing protein n=1 Tax=Effrenium voratum TaxID=2562239 RepID=A0AA36HRT0_9DINO|nr:unnamed protein product [Effrenium voratum]
MRLQSKSSSNGEAKKERPYSAEMSGSRTVQREVSRHLAALARARHLQHSPERRVENEPEAEVIPRIGNTLVPYRIHEPATHAQRLSQLCYEKYKKNEAAMEAGTLRARTLRKPLAPTRSVDFGLLPNAWRPTWEDVLAESHASHSPLALAAANLIAGRSVAKALRPEEQPEGLEKLQEGVLDLKAWVRLANGGSTRSKVRAPEFSELPKILAMPEKVLAALFLLHDVSVVQEADLSGMGLEKAPSALRTFPGLRSIDLSHNRTLTCLQALGSCMELQAVRLCGCQKLWNLKPLASLPVLLALDLADCDSLTDLRGLLAGYEGPRPEDAALSPRPPSRGRSPATQARDQVQSGALTQRSARAPREETLLPRPVRPLGHPTLRWLGLSGCKNLHSAELLTACQDLCYVDLFDCSSVDGFHCFCACNAAKVEHLVWPSLDHLTTFAKQAALPAARTWELLSLAVDSVRQKQRCLEDHAPLPPLQKLARTAAREAAQRAEKDLGAVEEVQIPKTWLFPEEMPDTDVEDEMSDGLPDTRGTVSQCIHPYTWVRKLRADGFKPGPALQGTQLFHALDRDRDGLLSQKEFAFLDQEFGSPEEVNEAIGFLLKRHQMVHDVVAKDLAGNRKKIDTKRLVECMVIAGAEEECAQRASAAILYCTNTRGTCQEALQQGLGGFVLVYTMSLLQSLQQFLMDTFGGLKRAFEQLDITGRRRITLEDFTSVISDLQWPDISPGVLEVMFRLLDRDCTGAFLEKDMAAFEQFNAEKCPGSATMKGASSQMLSSMKWMLAMNVSIVR